MNSKIIKLVTFHRTNSHGAMLQAYSLYKFITSLGYEVEFIDYSTRDKVQLKPFADFAKEYLPTTQRINTFAELEDIHADVLICGSDQIWNLDISLSEGSARRWDYYFLNFGKSSAKRIAYAASCGGVPIRDEFHSTARKALNKFDHISVRESETKTVISGLTNKLIETVLDPVFLTEDFPIKKPEITLPDRYIAMFSVGRSIPLYKTLYAVKESLRLPMVVCDPFGKCPVADIHLPMLRPDEWLYFISRSDFLCTNSFHAISFALKFKKQFLAIPIVKRSFYYACLRRLPSILEDGVTSYLVKKPVKIKQKQIGTRMCRVDEILSIAGLSDRIIKTISDIRQSFNKIDHEAVSRRLETAIAKSKAYLRQSIK